MRLIIDLDGTICTEEKTFRRSLAKPIKGAKEALRKLRNRQHTIIIYSARSWNEYEMTEDWLRKHKIPFDQLVMGKPVGDSWIDDRAVKFDSWENVLSTLDL